MKTLSRRTVPSLALALTLVLPATLVAQTRLTIVHVNDTHSHLDSFGPRDANLEGTIGGLERAAGVVATLKATEPNVLFLHAGDAFHGDFFFNAYFDVPELAVLKQLGVDAMTVGNHEFDLTPAALVGALNAVGPFPMLGTNLDFSACPLPPTPEQPCGALPMWVKKSVLKTVGGVNVGIFGMTIPTDPTMQPKPVVVRADVVALAQQAVADLRSRGAQVIVFLSHLGGAGDRALVSQVEGIDVVVQGHDHALYHAPVWLDTPGGRAVPAVSAGDNYLHVGRLRLTYTPDVGVSVDGWDALPVDETTTPVPAIAAIVDQAKAGIVQKYGDVYQTVVGFAPWYLSKRYDPETSARDTAMGNLITDALRYRTRTQIALTVTGLVSEGIYEGPVVAADVFRPVSYGYDPPTGLGFKLATFEITGAELLKGMEMCLANVRYGDTFDLQFSGLRYRYDSSLPVFQRIVPGNVYVGWHRIDPARTYTVTSNQGIAMLLPGLGVKVSNVQVLPDFEYSALKDYVELLRVVPYTTQYRIRDVAAPAAN